MFKSEYDMREAGTWDESAQTVTETICPYCGVGCAVELHAQDDRIVKVTSPSDSSVTDGHLCIKGRFGFEFVNNRPARPLPLSVDLGKPGSDVAERVILVPLTPADEWLTAALETDPEIMRDLGGPIEPGDVPALHSRRLEGLEDGIDVVLHDPSRSRWAGSGHHLSLDGPSGSPRRRK